MRSPTWLLLAAPALALAQTTTLTPPAQRISDQAIQSDLRGYEALQGRIKTLNDRGRPLRDHWLAKAQCWLDVSFHEYTRNDRSAFPQAALTEAEKLVAGMESGAALGSETPLVNGAARLRDDLWQRAAALRGHAGWQCAQAAVGCAEVELVHAGNESNQQQWRHAKPYIQIAEDRLVDADAAAQSCVPPPPPPVTVSPPPQPQPPQRLVQRVLTASIVFAFDRSGPGDVRNGGLAQLQQLLQGADVQSVRLVGYADRLNGTGESDYNQRLSERRVQTVRDALVAAGVPAAAVGAEARGDRQQVAACQGPFASRAALEECLLPNRRVDVLIETRPR